METAAAARTADGIGIYASYCRVERVKTDGHQGHHLIAWNDSFPLEGIPVGARHDNVVADCLSVNRGLRNMLDFASTEDIGMGSGYDQHINYRNVFRNNTVIGGEIVVHTGWDTFVEGNSVVDGGGITVHTASRRVKVSNNFVRGGSITLRGGLADAVTVLERASKDIEAVGNTVIDPGSSGIYVVAVDGYKVEDNTIRDALSFGVNPERASDGTIRRNRISGGEYGIRQNNSSDTYTNAGISVMDNHISGSGILAIYLTRSTGVEVLSNHIEGQWSGGGIFVAHAESVGSIVRDNRVTSQGVRGIRVQGPQSVVEGNVTHKRIDAEGANSQVRNNIITNHGIVLASTAENSVVIGNTTNTPEGVLPVRGNPPGLVARHNILNGVWVDTGVSA